MRVSLSRDLSNVKSDPGARRAGVTHPSYVTGPVSQSSLIFLSGPQFTGTPDIEGSVQWDPRYIGYNTCKIDSECFNFFRWIFLCFTCGGCLDSRSRVCVALSDSDLAIVGYLWRVPPVTARQLSYRDGHLLADEQTSVSIGNWRVRVSLLRRRSVVRIGHEELRH